MEVVLSSSHIELREEISVTHGISIYRHATHFSSCDIARLQIDFNCDEIVLRQRWRALDSPFFPLTSLRAARRSTEDHRD